MNALETFFMVLRDGQQGKESAAGPFVLDTLLRECRDTPEGEAASTLAPALPRTVLTELLWPEPVQSGGDDRGEG